MATPNFEQIQSFAHVTDQLKEAAVEEFMGEVTEGMTPDEVIAEAVRIAEKFRMLGSELGAQWYDLCAELAGVEVDPATVEQADLDGIEARATAAMGRTETRSFEEVFASYLNNEIMSSVRETGDANLWRDYGRGIQGGKWARVPVGDTCAWCLMLASNGAWYLSEKTALGKEAGHYHSDCNCIAVYYADGNDIKGYEGLRRYKSMYYDAENARIANENGTKPYDEELARRIAEARARHDADFEAGITDKKWTKYNEDMIILRERYGLK